VVKVEVVRSRQRHKTVQARQIGDVVRVSVPATMSRADEERWVKEMLRRIGRRQRSAGIDLHERARGLAGKFGLAMPNSTRWVDNQNYRWGSCTPHDGTIRISSRLAKEPSWVLDYVLVHELAHLKVSGHGKAFWQLVNRYPLAERARGFLMARGVDEPEDEPESLPQRLPQSLPQSLPGLEPSAGL
jgi:predicted metal-dependent hydrolase